MSDKNFAQAFCESFDIPRDRFVDSMLKRTLYPHVRIFLVPLCACLRRHWFDRDREIIDDLGDVVDIDEMRRLLSRLPWYYGNSWNLRREFRLRISSRRTLHLARRVGLAKSRKTPLRKADTARIAPGALPAV